MVKSNSSKKLPMAQDNIARRRAMASSVAPMERVSEAVWDIVLVLHNRGRASSRSAHGDMREILRPALRRVKVLHTLAHRPWVQVVANIKPRGLINENGMSLRQQPGLFRHIKAGLGTRGKVIEAGVAEMSPIRAGRRKARSGEQAIQRGRVGIAETIVDAVISMRCGRAGRTATCNQHCTPLDHIKVHVNADRIEVLLQEL